MAPTFLFALCIAAVIAVALVGLLFSGGGGASRAQKERFDRRHAAIVEAKEKAAAATVTPLPAVADGPAPVAGERAA